MRRRRIDGAAVIARSASDAAIQMYMYIMTNDLSRRVGEHRSKMGSGFTARYNVTKLVYYEIVESTESAIAREKQIKAGSRLRKVSLIESRNMEWRDLSGDLL